MTFTFDGRLFRICFTHVHPTGRVLTGPTQPCKAVTTCYIEEKPNHSSAWSVVNRLEGWAWCSLQDVYSKDKGRKLSLQRALEYCGVLTDGIPTWNWRKAFRTVAWTAYLGRKS